MALFREVVLLLQIFKTAGGKLNDVDTFEEGAWINLTNPTHQEISRLCYTFSLEPDYIRAALDEEERARIEYDDGKTLIVVDIPVIEKEGETNVYSTIPLGIVLTANNIITVCLKEDTLIKDFVNGRIKGFYTYYKNRFILQILHRNATQYLQYLKQIDKFSNKIEQDLHKSMKNKELIQLLKLEKSLVYFSTSLKSNEVVLEKMMKLEHVKKYPDDTDLLEDVIIENKQAIEMANIYSSILSGTMDAFASVISNNVNIVMKFLTSVTIVMAIPTMVASFFGMNVAAIPFSQYPHAFNIVVLISAVLAALSAYFLAKRKMF